MAVATPRPVLGLVLLVFVSAAWGSAFPLMKDLIVRMPVADLLTERYGIATLVLLALRPRSLRGLSENTWRTGITLGVLFGVGQTAQAVSLHDLPSSVSGFTVGSYVVITPVLGLFLLGARTSARVWAAVALATAAMTAFALMREAEGEIALPALVATLSSAVLYAIHTLLLGNSAEARENAYAVTVIQLGTIAVMTGALAAPDGLTLPSTPGDWVILGHLSVVACALGFLARSWGQIHVSPVSAAVILSTQPLWVTALAVTLHREPLTAGVYLGGGLIALAMLLVVSPWGALSPARRERDPVPPPRPSG